MSINGFYLAGEILALVYIMLVALRFYFKATDRGLFFKITGILLQCWLLIFGYFLMLLFMSVHVRVFSLI